MFYNTKLHYKIWFSKDQSEFLDIENQLRFIRAVKKNPGAVFTLIYSAKCLNDTALADLKSFSEQYGIQIFDFDSEIRDLIVDDYDRVLYRLAEDEIQRTILNQGGNFSSASDIIRLIVPVIEKFGNYGDFEKIIDFSFLDHIIELPPSILLPITLQGNHSFFMNNDLYILSVDGNDKSKLSSQAIQMIKHAQQALIENYQDPISAIFDGWHEDDFGVMRYNPFVGWVFSQFFNLNPESTIFELRKFIKNLDFLQITNLMDKDKYFYNFGTHDRSALSEQELKIKFGMKKLNDDEAFFSKFDANNFVNLTDQYIEWIKHIAFKYSIMAISGPQVAMALFKNDFPDKIYCPQKIDPVTQLCSYTDEYLRFYDILENHSVKKHLDSIFLEPKKEDENTNHPLNDGAPCCDLSWTSIGEVKKRGRIEKLRDAVHTIEHAWQHYKRKAKANSGPITDIPHLKSHFYMDTQNEKAQEEGSASRKIKYT